MKVVLVNTLYPPNVVGGAEVSVQALAVGLAENGHDVTVVTLDDRCERSTRAGVRIYYERLNPLGNMFLRDKPSLLVKGAWYLLGERNSLAYRRLRHFFDAESPDVVHTNNLVGLSVDVWRAANELGVPLVHTVRDYYLICLRNTMFRAGRVCANQCWRCQLATIYRRRQSRLVQSVVGISNFILARHLDAGYFSNTSQQLTIYNGFDVRSPAASDRRFPKAGRLRIGYIGRLHPTKGVHRLLAAVKGLDPTTYDVRIAGRGEPHYEQDLRQIAHGLPVKFCGWVEPELFYRSVDVVVVPSVWNEPMGRTIIEALAYGLPVIASDRGGMPELIQDGKDGFIFNPEHPTRLKDILSQFIRNRRPIAASGSGATSDRFSINAMVKHYELVYRSISRRRRVTADATLEQPHVLPKRNRSG